jgi:predicted AlkP superfamily pyrophosphatase or phosphodiesterase
MKKLVAIAAILGTLLQAEAQGVARPKLVVGLVVDQMRWDYLYRYSDRYTPDGFKRLLGQGFTCENTIIPYTPTYTAPGHTCVYTGSVPALHGIIGNSWYDRTVGRSVYCTDDSTVTAVGSSSVWGRMSPRNMWASTIGDELHLATNFRGKNISIAMKDRGSILPGGHTANAAYWFDNTSGGWITSTYYMNTLPAWMNALNARHLPDSFLKTNWNTLYQINTYLQSTADDKPYEARLTGEDNTFLHRTDSIGATKYDAFRTTPQGSTYTLETAKLAIAAENLGKHAVTDFLSVSCSSPDLIGHAFGPNSVEIEDTYLRLDRDIASFLRYLDAAVGKGNYLLFLTADHGVAHAEGFAKEVHLPTGDMDDYNTRNALNDAVKNALNISGAVLTVTNMQVYLNEKALATEGVSRLAVKQVIIRELMKRPGIARAIDLESLAATTLPDKLKLMLTNGYNQKLSGDIQYILRPQWFEGNPQTGTTHGSWNPYDAHIPLVWFGWGVKPGRLTRETYMTDIAPTLAALLHIQMPNAAIGHVIPEVGAR